MLAFLFDRAPPHTRRMHLQHVLCDFTVADDPLHFLDHRLGHYHYQEKKERERERERKTLEAELVGSLSSQGSFPVPELQ